MWWICQTSCSQQVNTLVCSIWSQIHCGDMSDEELVEVSQLVDWVPILVGGLESIVFGSILWCFWSGLHSNPLAVPPCMFVCLFVMESLMKGTVTSLVQFSDRNDSARLLDEELWSAMSK